MKATSEAAGPLALEYHEEVAFRHLPPYSPELVPSKRPWELTDEPLANKTSEYLADVEAVLAERCVQLTEKWERSLTLYHWWPGGSDRRMRPLRPIMLLTAFLLGDATDEPTDVVVCATDQVATPAMLLFSI